MTTPDLDAARAALQTLYAELAAELARLAPVCELSGACCRFGEYDHDLFVTDLELAELFAAHGAPAAVDDPRAPDRRCPYQDGLACTAREGRPLGCRLFFCDPRYADAMPVVSGEFHRRLQALHDTHGIPYRYGELLRMLGAPADWAAPTTR